MVAIPIALGLFALALLPIGRLLLLWAALGIPALTTLLIVDGVASLARALSPVRALAWFKKPDANEPGVAMRIVTMEAAVAAVAVVLLAATAWWWQPLLGVAVPMWIVVLLVVRNAALMAMTSLSHLDRPLASMAAIVDIVVVVPVVALITRSFTGTVIASTVASLVFLAISARAGTLKKKDEPTEDDVRDRWLLGSWLQSLQNHGRRTWLVALGGASLAVPFSAVLTLMSVLMMPFVAVAATKPARSIVFRVLRGVLVAGAAFWLLHDAGPGIYRAVFPDAFGDGAWLEILAWSSAILIPIAIRGDAKRASQLRVGIAGAIAVALLVGLGITHGVDGVMWAISIGSVVGAVVGTTENKTDPLTWN